MIHNDSQLATYTLPLEEAMELAEMRDLLRNPSVSAQEVKRPTAFLCIGLKDVHSFVKQATIHQPKLYTR